MLRDYINLNFGPERTVDNAAPGLRWSFLCAFAAIALRLLCSTSFGQSYGPPNILDNNWEDPNFQGVWIASFQGEGYDFNGNPADIYSGGITVNANGTLMNLDGTYYQGFNGGGYFYALSADCRVILGVPAGILVYEPFGANPTPNPTYALSNTLPSGASSIPSFWNGSTYVTKFFGAAQYFQISDSPWYWYDGDQNQDFVVDASSGIWPLSNVSFSNSLPQQVFVNGRAFNLKTVNPSGGGQMYYEVSYYQGPTENEFVQLQRIAMNGTSSSGSSMISGIVADVGQWQGRIDPDSLQISGLSNDNLAIAFSRSNVDNPDQGPKLVSWNDNLLQFYYTTQDGKDLYWAPDNGDSTGDYTVIVASDNSVVAMHASISATGSYSSSPGVFSFSDTADTSDLLALDQNGNLFPNELPPGITFLFGSGEPGHGILGSTDFIANMHAYRRPNSWGVKFSVIEDGVYLVQDENGNYTAPPYKFVSASGDTVINAMGGWPATNIYPQQLYINGIYCTMVSGSQYDSGAGFPRNGGVSYRASAYDLTVVLSWNWVGTGTGFQGFITGKYGQSSSFRGSWDGLSTFSNMTNGAVASVTAPTNAPTDGNPPQVSVNGSALQYNSLASTALADAGTPGDVYSGPLGQTLTIYQNGSVSYVPDTGATAITGSYNATTHQFSFGTSGNTVTISNTDGSSSSTAMITATDTGGHNLATPMGGASNGNGVTELAGGLDVRGNTFSLGSWIAGGESVYGLGLTYNDIPNGSPSLLTFSSTRAAADWLWIHPSQDAATDQITAMLLDSAHRVQLFDPANPSNANIVLDPGGGSAFHGAVRIQPQGDIPMGNFQSGPTPP